MAVPRYNVPIVPTKEDMIEMDEYLQNKYLQEQALKEYKASSDIRHEYDVRQLLSGMRGNLLTSWSEKASNCELSAAA